MISFRWLTDHQIISSWSGSSVYTNQTLLRQFFHCFWSSFRNVFPAFKSSWFYCNMRFPLKTFTAERFPTHCWYFSGGLLLVEKVFFVDLAFCVKLSLVLLSAWLQSDQFIVSSCLLAPADQGHCVILHPFDCFWFSKSAAGCSDYFHFNDFLVVVVVVLLLLDLQFWRHKDFILQPLDGCIPVPIK